MFCGLVCDLYASLIAQLVKNLPAMKETLVQFLGRDDTLEKGKATHSSILAWGSPWTVQSMGLQRVGHDFHFPLLDVAFGEGGMLVLLNF